MTFEYKEYLLLRAIFPDNTQYAVTNSFVGTKSLSELLTRLVIKDLKKE